MPRILTSRPIRRGAAALGAVLALAMTAIPRPAHAATRPAGPLMPSQGALFGAYVNPTGSWGGNTAQEAQITSLETTIGRKLDVIQHYYAWTDTFPSGLEQWDLAGGRTSLISWHGANLDDTISGKYDSMIRTRADALKALGAPVFLRWCWEMNGNWSTCDGYHNNSSGQTDGPAKFVAAWRHIHDIFTAEGATNVVWVWCPNDSDIPSASWNHWTNYYPGDAYVDWVGIDGYNWGNTQSWSKWTSFASLFSRVYQDYASRKPIMISETASTEQGGDKATWISDARSAIQSQFPSIGAFMWFDEPKETSWQVDSSTSALNSYEGMAGDSYFHGGGGGGGGGGPGPLAITGVTASPQLVSKSTTISFTLNEPATVSVSIKDAQGTVVRHLVTNASYPTGTSSVRWNQIRGDDGQRVPAGAYSVVVSGSASGTQDTKSVDIQVSASATVQPRRTRSAIGNLTLNPSPMVGRTRITFGLARGGYVIVQVRKVSTGAIIRTLHHGRWLSSGFHAFTWWGRNSRTLDRVRPGTFRVVVLSRNSLGGAKATKQVWVVR